MLNKYPTIGALNNNSANPDRGNAKGILIKIKIIIENQKASLFPLRRKIPGIKRKKLDSGNSKRNLSEVVPFILIEVTTNPNAPCIINHQATILVLTGRGGF